jgi:hypothetical protein
MASTRGAARVCGVSPPSVSPSPVPGSLTDGIGALTGDGVATIVAALIAAAAAIVAYRWERNRLRKERRAVLYSEALRTVEEYVEMPYRVLRRDGAASTRTALTNQMSDIQARLAYYSSLLVMQAPARVSDSYKELVRAARAEAGRQVSEAWKARPLRRDDQVPRGAAQALRRSSVDDALNRTRAVMQASLGGSRGMP